MTGLVSVDRDDDYSMTGLVSVDLDDDYVVQLKTRQ